MASYLSFLICVVCILPDFSTSLSSNALPLDDNTTPADLNSSPSLQDELGSSLTFVFDETDSMYDDWKQVIMGAKTILETAMNNRDKKIYNFGLVPFNDPGKFINCHCLHELYRIGMRVTKTFTV